MRRRRGVVLLVTVAVVAALPCALAWALLSTEWGTGKVWPHVEARLPEGLTVGAVSGRVRGPLLLGDVAFRSAAYTVHIGRISIEWRLLPLLRRTLPIEVLSMEDVAVEVHSPDGDDVVAPLPAVVLPVLLSVERAVVRRLSLSTSAEAGTPVRLDSIDVRDLSFGSRLDVVSGTVVGPDIRVAARGWLEPRGEYALSADVEWDARIPDVAPTRGRLSLSGNLARLSVHAVVTDPVAAELSATVVDPRGTPTFEADLTVAAADAASIQSDWPPVRGEGTVTVAGGLDSLRAEVSARFDSPQTGPATLDGVFHRIDTTVVVQRLRATAHGARFEAGGRVVLATDEPAIDLEVSWADLGWPFDGTPRIVADTGWVTVRGTAGAYRVAGRAWGSQVDGPSTRVSILGDGTRERLVLDDFTATALDGVIRARGSVTWAPRRRWDLRVSADDVDPSSLLADSTLLEGRVSLRGRTRGTVGPTFTDGDVAVTEMRGTLRGEPLSLTTIASFRVPSPGSGGAAATAHVSFDELALTLGPNSLWAEGTVAERLDLAVRLTAPGLEVVAADARGEVEIVGRLTGSRATPHVEGTVVGRGLAYQGREIEDLSLDVDIDSEPGGVVSVEGTATGVTSGEQRLDSVVVKVSGAPEAHEIAGRVMGRRGIVDLEAAGGVEERAWTGTVGRFDFDVEPWGSWELGDSVRVRLSQTRSEMERACWDSGSSTACAEGWWEAEGSTGVDASVGDLSLERFEASLPDGWTLAGVLQADASVRIAADGTLLVTASADPGSGTVSYPTSAGRRELHYSGARLGADIDQDGARARVTLTVSAEAANAVADLEVHLALPDYNNIHEPLPSQAATGRIVASANDLSALEAALSGVDDLTGVVTVDLSLSGSVERPELQGEARLSGGSVDVPRLGLEVRDAELVAVGQGLGGLALEGGARSGSGTVRISGRVPVVLSDSTAASIHISGDRFQVLEVPEASIWISPEVDVTASAGRVDLTGQVRVPRARVELTEVPSTGVAPSRDVVFVGDSSAAGRRDPDIHTSVRVVLGDSVSFRGFGLTAEPRGSILATDAPGRATTGTGEITLTGGRYRAYGQELLMERGRILYAGGPIDNPGLDIRATRRARDGVVAGLDIKGTVRAPEVTIFSQPTMIQSDALAYIMLGRPLGTASSSEGSLVAGAAVSLGIKGGNILAGRIAQRFGLAEVRIEAEGPLEAASLVAGKYLSPRLYVSYGVGLFEPINVFRMRYTLSRLWTLQAETGKAAGADLLYRIERGR